MITTATRARSRWRYVSIHVTTNREGVAITKHITKPAAEADVAERSPSVWGRPFGQIDFDEWFDRWPELFARRWPESFRGFPGADTAFKREECSEERDNGNYRSEFRYGSLARSVRLPDGADEEGITATFKAGILDVRVPRNGEPAPVKTISVTTDG